MVGVRGVRLMGRVWAVLRLPDIQKTIQEMLRTTEAQLAELPREPSQDPVGEVYAMITQLAGALDRWVEGTPSADGLLQTIRPKQQEFRDAVRNTAPDFRPFERADAGGAAASLTLPEFLSNEETPGLPVDDAEAIYVDEVMALALQWVAFRVVLT